MEGLLISKSLKEANLNNAFLFAATLSDPNTCKLVLEIILGEELQDVEVHAEHTVLFSSDFRMVRFDVLATSNTQVNYNIESQNSKHKSLALRSRFHQAEVDIMSLKPGQGFDELKPVYVIFVCTFDPFNSGLYKYTFENTCQENGKPLGDGAKRIFLNTKGHNPEDVSAELLHFLGYLERSDTSYVSEINDANIDKLHKRVMQVKNMPEMEGMYMTGAEWLEEMKEAGLAEGRAAGRTEGRTEGLAEGCAKTLLTFLEAKWHISDQLKEQIMFQKDMDVLDSWIKSAIISSSIDEFIERM